MANMIVSGAGKAAVNGVYVEDGIWNDKPVYSMDSPDGVYGRLHLIYTTYQGDQWVLSRRGSESRENQIWLTANYQSEQSDVPTPDLAINWKGYQGAPPAPTVKAEGAVVPAVTPECRTYVIPSEDRTIVIRSENRTIVIPAENRTYKIKC